MTRRLNVAREFPEATLVEVTPHPDYPNNGSAHAYYVPEKARMDAGLNLVSGNGSADEFHDEATGSWDWDGIRDLVSAHDLVERAEAQILNREDGDIGNTDPRHIVQWRSRSTTDQDVIPQGVVKFRDQDADPNETALRDPVDRGLYWGELQEAIRTSRSKRQLTYQQDVERDVAPQARVPMDVVWLGDEMIAAYLAAHDHHDRMIAHTLDCEADEIQRMLEEVASPQ